MSPSIEKSTKKDNDKGKSKLYDISTSKLLKSFNHWKGKR
ncbi:hypothetical protein CASFOL_020050 [Castilleja foliolosa]|uniref:Uncharacterized protein n=1 Tax=Castilleja foliolosa TaxID=1961234 RepID=A0ABD3CZR3_9LAMI